MDANLLASLFGKEGRWSGPCTIILDADANIQSIGGDAIIQGGVKSFSPRLITGRVLADHIMLLPDRNALLLIKRTIVRQSTGEDQINHMLQVIDVGHIVAVEFDRLDALERLGVKTP